MPRTEIIIYKENSRESPLIEWLDHLHPKVQDKWTAKIELLEENGYDLRRPHCDILEQGIYELRVRWRNVHYRILYGFVGQNIVLLSHGFSKKNKVPKSEIRLAVQNMERYRNNPDAHTYLEG